MNGENDSTKLEVEVLFEGGPCRCGPGFCASQKGVGFIGHCSGSRQESGPDCPICGAPHQSTDGCWAGCDRELSLAKEAVEAVRLDISWREAEFIQEECKKRGRDLSFMAAIREAASALHKKAPPVYYLLGLSQKEANASLNEHGEPFFCSVKGGCTGHASCVVLIKRPGAAWGQDISSISACDDHAEALLEKALKGTKPGAMTPSA